MNEALCTITITVNERKKLFRYDEAIRLIERLCTTGQDAFEWHKALEDGRDFLATEPKKGKVVG